MVAQRRQRERAGRRKDARVQVVYVRGFRVDDALFCEAVRATAPVFIPRRVRACQRSRSAVASSSRPIRKIPRVNISPA